MVLSLSQMDQEGTHIPNVTLRGYPMKFWGLCGEVAHIAQEKFVIGQFAKTESFQWSRCPW